MAMSDSRVIAANLSSSLYCPNFGRIKSLTSHACLGLIASNSSRLSAVGNMGKRKSASGADGSKSKAPKALPPVETIETGHLRVFRCWLFLGSTCIVAMELVM